MMELYAMEMEWRNAGFNLVCGVDEAGRGPLAGPVYAAAVILPENVLFSGLNDSKKLSPASRDSLYDEITGRARCYCVAPASVTEIDKLNILEATLLAMRRAVDGLGISPDIILVDGNVARGFKQRAVSVTGGDGKCAAIAAASILAKVTRDRYMENLVREYPQYGFEVHKGYGTKLHRERILLYGPCPEHRPLFLRKLTGGSK